MCPVDGQSVLVMTERQGIEIDYCPTCRGVWLDRGELDKIIERVGPDAPVAEVPGSGSHQPQPAPQQPYAAPPPGAVPQPDIRSYPAQAYGSKAPRGAYGYDKRKKKSGFLSDLFEF